MTSEQDSRGFGAFPPKPGPPPGPKPGPSPTSGVSPTPGVAGPSVDADAAAAQVASVLAGLDDLDERPVAEHVAVYEAVHRTLQDTLAAVDGS